MSATANTKACGILTREEIAKLRAAGVHPNEIAARAGVARGTIYHAMRAWRLTVQQRGGDRRSRAWLTLYREQLAAAIAGVAT